MTDILLVNPNKVEYPCREGDISGTEASPPLGLLSLGATLRQKGHQVRVFDRQTTEGKPDLSRELDEYAKELEEGAGPDIVGITCVTPFRRAAKGFITKTREVYPDVKIVVGGPDATFARKEYLGPVCADVVVLGEGEFTLVALADGVEESRIPGIAYMDNGDVSSTGMPGRADLDKLPVPARELVKLDRYPKEAASMITSRGCLYHCVFCCSSKLWGPEFRTRSPEKIAEEVDLLHRKFGYDVIRHHDDNWACRPEAFITDLVGELRKRDLIGRVTHEVETSPVTLDETKIRLMKQMGVDTVWISMETAEPRLLQYLNKPYCLSDVEEAVRLLRRENIAVGLYVIFGMPDETYAQAKGTVDRAWAFEPAYVGASILTAYPGTKLYDDTRRGVDFGSLLPSLAGWAHWGRYLGQKMSEHELRKVFAYAYNRFGNRLGNSYRLRRLFQLGPELQELIEIVRDSDQASKIRHAKWLELEEKGEEETKPNTRAALEVAYEDATTKIMGEPIEDRFHTIVRAKFECESRFPTPEGTPVSDDQLVDVGEIPELHDLREQAYRNLVERIGKTAYFAGVTESLNAYRDAVIENDEHVQLNLFEEIVTELWPENMGRDGMRTLFETARKSEPLLAVLGLRKHFLHQFHVFLLGSYIIAELQDSMSESTEAKQLNLMSEGLYDTWLIASAFHDIGLIAAKCPELNLELASIFESLGFNQRAKSYKRKKRRADLLEAQITTQNGNTEAIDLMKSLQAWFRESGIMNGGTIEHESEENHGILGAIIMLRRLAPFLKANHGSTARNSILLSRENKDIAVALAAIAVHSLDTGAFSKQLNFKNDPVPFLLRLTDEMDEEQRMMEVSEDRPDLCVVHLDVAASNGEKTIELGLTPSAYLRGGTSGGAMVNEENVRDFYSRQKKWLRVGNLSGSRLSGCSHSVAVTATVQLAEPLQLFRTIIIER